MSVAYPAEQTRLHSSLKGDDAATKVFSKRCSHPGGTHATKELTMVEDVLRPTMWPANDRSGVGASSRVAVRPFLRGSF